MDLAISDEIWRMKKTIYLADLIKIQIRDEHGFVAFENYAFVPRFSDRHLSLFPNSAMPELHLSSSGKYIYIIDRQKEEAYLCAKINFSDDELELIKSTIDNYLADSKFLHEEPDRRFPIDNTAYADAIEAAWYSMDINPYFIDEQLQACGLELFLIKDNSVRLNIIDKVRAYREFYINQILKTERHLGVLLLVPKHKIYKRKIY